jgi:glycosyltransferase involved in cell wall biosynthesis
LIFPGREDFGLVMAEAQSFGKPVIAFRGGGALDIVQEGVTGRIF